MTAQRHRFWVFVRYGVIVAGLLALVILARSEHSFAGTKHTTTTMVSCSPSSVAVDATTSCTATVTDTDPGPTTPTGTVGLWASTGAGTFSPTSCTLSYVSTSVADCSVGFTPPLGAEGAQDITAKYGGDATHDSSTNNSSPFALTVTKRTTSTTVSCSPGSLDAAATATVCTAAVADTSSGTTSTPTGTVDTWASTGSGSFSATSCTLSSGSCPVDFTPALGSEGTQQVTAVYEGDTDHATSNNDSSPFALTVQARTTSTTVTCSPGSLDAAAAATSCTATVTDTDSGTASTPSGTVGTWATSASGTFSPTSCALAPVSTGVADCSVNFTPANGSEGTQHITAVYGGDTDHATSNNDSSPFALTVTARTTSTTVACSPSVVAVDAATSCTATVTDTDSGTPSTPTGIVGTWATSRSGTFSPTSCALAPVSTGVADCSVGFTPALGAEGTQGITAVYGDDTDHTSSNNGSSPFTVTATKRPTSTTVVCSPSPVAAGTTITCTATVNDTGSGTASTPTGTVDTWFSTGSGSFSTMSCTLGAGSCSVDFTPALGSEGTQDITAVYEGDTDHATSNSSSFDLTVTTRPTSTAVVCSPSTLAVDPATVCTATVTDTGSGTASTPTGIVGTWASSKSGTFNPTSCTLAPVSTGVADCSVAFTPALGSEGTQDITAVYGGDTDHATSNNDSSPFALTATTRATSTTVSCAPPRVAVEDSTTCTATVIDTDAGNAVTPTGTVDTWATSKSGTFSPTSCSLSPISAGVAACSVGFTPAPGSEDPQEITASYEGDTDHAPSNNGSSPYALTVVSNPGITSAPTCSARVGVPFTCLVTTAGPVVPHIRSKGKLPHGVLFRDDHDGSATISGTPISRRHFSAVGTYHLRIMAKFVSGRTKQVVVQFLVLTVTP